MKISVIVEGATEAAFKPALRAFLEQRLAGRMPALDFVPQDGRIPTDGKLRGLVRRLLGGADAVIALTDVYTGTNPRLFEDAQDAKARLREWVGDEPRFYAHAAQYEFEAWLLPYWGRLQQKAGNHDKAAPRGNPEDVDHDKPPSRHIEELFRTAKRRRKYIKTRDAAAVLRDVDLSVAARQCRELRLFLNTILTLCDGQIVPDN